MDKVILNISVIIILFFSVLSCKNNTESYEKENIEVAQEIPSWLIGTWKQDQEDDEEPYIEIWKQKGDTLLGGGYFTDQLVVDTLNPQVRIYAVKAGLVHEFLSSADLTLFPMKFIDQNAFICVNPDQKTFPSSLKYTRLSDKQMIIEITGNVDGMQDSYAFNMYKQ